MPDYDFSNLSPIDFENLTRDLLQKEFNVTFETFKPGKDQGIDLRFSKSSNKTIIVQCKHYLSSGIKQLLSKLNNKEKAKVVKLKPKRYVLVTSVALSPSDKDKIKSIFEPYIKSTGDIFGKDDLNNLLGKYKDVEKKNFKLWINSIHVLEEILHSKTVNISNIEIDKIRRHAKYYVYNESFTQALKILSEHNFCIISGIPGIGKTTLAEMLCLNFLDNDWEIIKVTDDISEAISLGLHGKKRLFYYDDFLGQASIGEKLNKNEDQRLIDFIKSIKNSNTSKLILTTREYILNQAKMTYEKISLEEFDSHKCVIDLTKYNRRNRAEILFNHIYFSDILCGYKESILSGKNYLKIIDHKNYSPRIIDLMTQMTRLHGLEKGDYLKAFLANLDNPLAIWQHAFENQITQASRNLLILMATLPANIFLEDLKKVFTPFHKALSEDYHFKVNPRDFEKSLKELDDNFIKTIKSRDRIVISFHSPSIRDFLNQQLLGGGTELNAIILNAKFFDQFNSLWQLGVSTDKDSGTRQLVKNDISLFLDALDGGIEKESCRTIDVRLDDGETYKSIWSLPIEAKTGLIVSVHAEISTDISLKLLDKYIERVLERITTKKSDKSTLITLLLNIKYECPSYHLFNELIHETKNLLVDEVEYIDDVECYCRFRREFPDEVTENDTEIIAESFEEISNEDLWYNPSDPEEYRRYANDIREIADELKMDMNERIRHLEDLALELEREMGFYEEDVEGDYSSSNNENFSDADIESVFNILTD